MKAILGVIVMALLATSVFFLGDSHQTAADKEPAAARSTPVASAQVQSRPIPQTGVAPRPAPRTRQQPPVQKVLAAIHAITPDAEIGLKVIDRKSGATFGYGRNTQFFSASLVKLLIAIDALSTNGTSDPEYVARIRYMLSYSDDQTASRLWVDDGGPQIVTRTAARIGLRDAEPPQDPGQWGATLVTAADVARIYTYLLTRLPRQPREIILTALRDAGATGSDGTYQFFGIPDGLPGIPRAIKQGWTSYRSKLEMHTTGLVGNGDRYIVVLLTGVPIETGEQTLAAAITAGIRALGSAIT